MSYIRVVLAYLDEFAYFVFQSLYKENYEKTKDKNKYTITDTEKYKSMKEGEKVLSDVSITKKIFTEPEQKVWTN